MTDIASLDLVQQRTNAAIRVAGDGGPWARRIAAAPPGYLLAFDSSDLARHARLLTPVPLFLR